MNLHFQIISSCSVKIWIESWMFHFDIFGSCSRIIFNTIIIVYIYARRVCVLLDLRYRTSQSTANRAKGTHNKSYLSIYPDKYICISRNNSYRNECECILFMCMYVCISSVLSAMLLWTAYQLYSHSCQLIFLNIIFLFCVLVCSLPAVWIIFKKWFYVETILNLPAYISWKFLFRKIQ